MAGYTPESQAEIGTLNALGDVDETTATAPTRCIRIFESRATSSANIDNATLLVFRYSRLPDLLLFIHDAVAPRPNPSIQNRAPRRAISASILWFPLARPDLLAPRRSEIQTRERARVTPQAGPVVASRTELGDLSCRCLVSTARDGNIPVKRKGKSVSQMP